VIFDGILNRRPTSPLDLNPDVPAGLERIVIKAVEKDRQSRYQQASELLEDLKQLKRAIDSGQTHTRGVAVHRRRSRRTIRSLAVLPFENASGDADTEYLSDAITESIINNLSQLPKLRVMARSTVFHYKGREIDPLTAGRELNVGSILTGRIVVRGDTLRLGAELVDVGDGSQLWGEQYHRRLSDIFSVQEEVAKEISEKLRLRLTSAERKRLAKRHTEDLEAYQFYLKGRYYWNKRSEEDLTTSLVHFQQAINQDPAYALAYAGVADCYHLLAYYTSLPPKEAFPRAKAAVLKALEIDPALAEAHTSLAAIRATFDWDWDGAGAEYKQAMQLNAGYATTHHWHAFYLLMLGRIDDALAAIRRAQGLDPLSLVINADVGWCLYNARQYEQAIEQYRYTLEMELNFSLAHYDLGLAYVQTALFEDAISEFERAMALSGRNSEMLAGLGYAYARSGRKEEALGILGELKLLSQERYLSPSVMAELYMGLDERDQAFVWLEKCYEERSPWLSYLKVEPRFDRLRSDPRFQSLLRRMNFPE
jgi:TolB-like protein